MSHARARCWIHEDCLGDFELSIACGPNSPDMQVLDGDWDGGGSYEDAGFGGGYGGGNGFGNGFGNGHYGDGYGDEGVYGLGGGGDGAGEGLVDGGQ